MSAEDRTAGRSRLVKPGSARLIRQSAADFEKHDGDITQLDAFGRLATETLRNLFDTSLLPALTYVSNVVMRTIPRELDYIAKNEGQCVNGKAVDLNSLRAQLADRLVTMCVAPDLLATASADTVAAAIATRVETEAYAAQVVKLQMVFVVLT